MFGPPKDEPPERVLTYGGSDTGKTRAALMIAKRLAKSQSPGHVYVMDTDNSWARMMRGQEFRSLTNVTIRPARKWTEYRETLTDYLNKVTPHDWIVIDFYGSAWSAVQAHYIATIEEKDFQEWVEERAKEAFHDMERGTKKGNKRSMGGFEGRSQWDYINKWFFDFRDDLLWASSHVYATASAANLEDSDARSLKDFCRDVEMKPVGQKATVHVFHTVLYLAKEAKDERTFTSVKDRERKKVEGKRLGDFSISYLSGIAGWSDPDEDDDEDDE